MSVQILVGDNGVHEVACYYCTTSDWAFGPVMHSREEAEAFLKHVPGDPRSYEDAQLESLYSAFVQSYVCECGEVRQTECPWCDAGEPIDTQGQHGDDEGWRVECELDPEPANGERFQCRRCAAKKAKAAA